MTLKSVGNKHFTTVGGTEYVFDTLGDALRFLWGKRV